MADAIVPVAVDDISMARLNVTYNGQNGDLPDPVPYDATEASIKAWATEAVSNGNIPGINPVAADFSEFVVDRFPANEGVTFNRLSLRPKTPFGA
jgi:hypothetical protein